MRNKQEDLEVQDLTVDLEVPADALVQNDSPSIRLCLLFSRVVADSVAPIVPDLPDFESQIVHSSRMVNFDRIGDELEVELIEVSLNINALHVLVIPVVD